MSGTMLLVLVAVPLVMFATLLVMLFLVAGAARRGGMAVKQAAVPAVPDATRDRVLPLIAQGRKILAIKEVRADTGLGLKEAKDYVDALRDGRVTAPLSDRVRAARDAAGRDAAVDLVRAETGMTRDEAARFVDALG